MKQNYTLPTQKERDAYMAGQAWGEKKERKRILKEIENRKVKWVEAENLADTGPKALKTIINAILEDFEDLKQALK